MPQASAADIYFLFTITTMKRILFLKTLEKIVTHPVAFKQARKQPQFSCCASKSFFLSDQDIC